MDAAIAALLHDDAATAVVATMMQAVGNARTFTDGHLGFH